MSSIFSFAGKAGKFILNPEQLGQDTRVLPAQKMKVEYLVTTAPLCAGTVKHIYRWIITTEDGTKYTFSELECTETLVVHPIFWTQKS